MSIFKLENAQVIYGEGESEVKALDGITMEVQEKEILCIMGPSGSGKSTLLNVLSGLERLSNGSVWYKQEEITKFNQKKLAKLRLYEFGFVYQNFYLLPTLNVKDNICIPTLAGSGRVNQDFFNQVTEELGLDKRLYHMPHQLSGGEKQRVAIARAILNKPNVIFADEPTGNLDSTNGQRVFELLLETTRKYDRTLVYITHDESKAALASRVLHLKDGVIVNEGE